ncbi:MAG: cupin domain-containing protein [Shimia sp.]
MQNATTAAQLIDTLGLQPHPEGGHYRQTWIADAPDGERPVGTCIYFLLAEGEASHWHRVDATEIWHFYAGDPLTLSLAATEEGPAQDLLLTPDLRYGAPQIIVPEGHWQAARSTGGWTLVGCTVSPAFQFEGFELAAPGFDIPRG